MAILPGDLEICLAAAAGIISIDVMSKIPTILTHVATNITSNTRNKD